MTELYKVYFGERSISFINAEGCCAACRADGSVFSSEEAGGECWLQNLAAEFDKAADEPHITVRCTDTDAAFELFKKGLKVEVAAGGAIFRKPLLGRDRLLLFFRRGFWDMPKGHVEEGETLEQCAVREVQEETGLEHLVLGEKVCVTFHTYHMKGSFVLKESHWYRMTSAAREPLKVQTEEDIVKGRWCSPRRARRLLRHAYPSIRDVAARL